MTTVHDQFADLDALLSGDEPPYDTEPEAPIDADRANGMLRTLGRLQRELDAAKEMATAEHARVDLWLTLEADRIGKRVTWLRSALELFHERLLREDARRKTVHLPNGTLAAKAQPPEWQFDADTFIAWAVENAPDLIRQRPAPAPEVDKTAAKKTLAFNDGRAITEHGEFVPGVTVIERGPRFTATPET